MSRRTQLLLLDAFFIACFAILVYAVLAHASLLIGAPTPRAKPAKPAPPLSKATLAGRWVLKWGGCDYEMSLTASGGYGATPGNWIGSFSFEKGRNVWHLTETCNPGDAESWVHWEIKLDPKALSGRVVGMNGRAVESGVEIRLERKK